MWNTRGRLRFNTLTPVNITREGSWIEGVMMYQITQPDGTEAYENYPFNAPLFSVNDYLELFSASGLSAEVYFNYKRQLPSQGKDVLCFVCSKVK